MHAQEFNVNLAAITGFEETQVRTADRVLSDAGLRTKAVGRSLPDVTLGEGVRLLMALCAAKNVTAADRVAHDLSRFSLLRFDAPLEVAEKIAKACFGVSFASLQQMNPIEAVGYACRHLAAGNYPTGTVWLEVEVGGVVLIQCEGQGVNLELQFTGAQDYTGFPGVQTIRRVRPNVLGWIGKVAA